MKKQDKFKIQVNKDHYYNNYDDILRWISYYYQIDNILKLKPKSVLEIGVGNKTTYNYLKDKINITTCDFDKNLKPDIVGDIRNLPIKDKTYDVVCAFEVLEHIPFSDFKKAIKELKRVSKKYVIISIPYSSIYFNNVFKFPLINRIFHKRFIEMTIKIPLFFKKHKFNGEHYWEIGKKGYPIKKIRKIIKTEYKIIKEESSLLNKYHYYFILQK
ncbi:MAG: class I SAM-dependent methyltransferase [Candidatus ainarchaeum sp.]|nr:class I SAM-dependent methyltransferase [Candidatus ainarchaeum sp.]MDD3975599.1 class I SAM-dependent methyltransferase [Candidatus ainarchaeum sp.]